MNTALSFFPKDKIDINSDELTINKNNLTSTFRHNVVIYFDKYKLTTKEVIIYYTKQRTIEKIIIPHRLKLINLCKTEYVLADNAIYNNKTNELSLTGNILLEKDGDMIKTNNMIYYSKPK